MEGQRDSEDPDGGATEVSGAPGRGTALEVECDLVLERNGRQVWVTGAGAGLQADFPSFRSLIGWLGAAYRVRKRISIPRGLCAGCGLRVRGRQLLRVTLADGSVSVRPTPLQFLSRT